jgi:ferrous iron transport protein A
VKNVRLDQLPLRQAATISAIEWGALRPSEARRLRELGLDEGVRVETLHLGPFGRDPIACLVGRMTIALRRAHAAAISVRVANAL